MKKLFSLVALVVISSSLMAQGYGNYPNGNYPAPNDPYDNQYYNQNNNNGYHQGYNDPYYNPTPQVTYQQTYYNTYPVVNNCNPPMPIPAPRPIIYAHIGYGNYYRRPHCVMPAPIPVYYGRRYHHRGGYHRRW